MFHVNSRGKTGRCRAKRGLCPFGSDADHYTTAAEARSAYERSMKGSFGHSEGLSRSRGTSARSGAGKSLRMADRLRQEVPEMWRDKIPESVLGQLGEWLDTRKERTLSVYPSGSMLYNTQIPGKAVHDYDFVVVTEPTARNSKIKQHLVGELDALVVPVDKLVTSAERSSGLTESIYTRAHGLHVFTDRSGPWSAYESSIRVPLRQYFSLLNDVEHSFRSRFTEPVTADRKEEFRSFKHSVRYQLYRLRSREELRNGVNPRLSEKERGVFLHHLSTGVLPFRLDERRKG